MIPNCPVTLGTGNLWLLGEKQVLKSLEPEPGTWGYCRGKYLENSKFDNFNDECDFTKNEFSFQ